MLTIRQAEYDPENTSLDTRRQILDQASDKAVGLLPCNSNEVIHGYHSDISLECPGLISWSLQALENNVSLPACLCNYASRTCSPEEITLYLACATELWLLSSA